MRDITQHDGQMDKFNKTMIDQTFSYLNKRAQRALGRSPEEKVKGQGEAIILI